VFVCVALLAIALGIFVSKSGAEDAEDQPEEARRARQLQKMKLSAAQYKLFPADDRERPFKFVEAPVLRWANPVGGAKDGTVFVWTDRGRPQAVLQLFTYDDDHFSHEWQSLADRPLTAERAGAAVWTPAEPALQFQELKDVDVPAATAGGRLRQMKSLAAKFSSTFTGFAQSPTPVELRLLTQPLYRYEPGADSKLVDGALFAFAQGTDPQMLLALEARTDGTTPRWEFAFARMASGSVVGRYGQKEVYSVPKYDFSSDPRKTFLLLARQPAPGIEE